jgi:hypothetical protein
MLCVVIGCSFALLSIRIARGGHEATLRYFLL